MDKIIEKLVQELYNNQLDKGSVEGNWYNFSLDFNLSKDGHKFTAAKVQKYIVDDVKDGSVLKENALVAQAAAAMQTKEAADEAMQEAHNEALEEVLADDARQESIADEDYYLMRED